MNDAMKQALSTLVGELDRLETEARIEALNEVRRALHQVSPFRGEPVDLVLWVPCERVKANDYNPNSVAPPEMELLRVSIQNDGYTQPIVGFESGRWIEVVDGFHRNRVGREDAGIQARIHGHLPVVQINEGRGQVGDRMAATVRHNRARGKHSVTHMSAIVVELVRRGWTDGQIAEDLGMERDEVLRLKQVTGLAELFRDGEFSEAWEVVEVLTEEEVRR